MSEMRLIVAGAGGRMGRTLTRVISETEGAVLAGALEAPGSELLGKDAGVLAGLPANGVELSADLRPVTGLHLSGWVAWNESKLTDVPASSGLAAREEAGVRPVASWRSASGASPGSFTRVPSGLRRLNTGTPVSWLLVHPGTSRTGSSASGDRATSP